MLDSSPAAPSTQVRTTGHRREPVQQRSVQNVERILEATSRVLSRHPLSEVTTTQVAHEAGISIGGLYRFFPDKQALIDAVAVRRLDEFTSELGTDLLLAGLADPPALLSDIIDRYVQFLDLHPDFRQIALGKHVSATTRQQHVTANTGVTAIVRRFVCEQLGASVPEELDLRLNIANEVGERLIAYAYEQPGREERMELLNELKRLLAGYLFS